MIHPITPPPELVQRWLNADAEKGLFAAKAAQWGADQELEACCEWVEAKHWIEPEFVDELRMARRPKTPSLKERALQAWAAVKAGTDDQVAMAVIRRALEALPE